MKLTNEQKRRINKYWDKSIVNGLMTSNIPRYIVKKQLRNIVESDSEYTFFIESKKLDILKKEYNKKIFRINRIDKCLKSL